MKCVCLLTPNEIFKIENILSAAADVGCTKTIFFSADDQNGKLLSLSFHHVITGVSEWASAAFTKYDGNSDFSFAITSEERNGNAVKQSMVSASGFNSTACLGKKDVQL